MRRAIKSVFLYVLRALGVFALARRLTANRLRILCYHGGSIGDEHRFMPGLFMTQATFRRRLAYLSRHRFPVLGLTEALKRLENNTLPACATVLTVDDGFYSTFCDAPGPLREFSFPATIYVTTYHAAKETPIFRLLAQYMFWKTDCRELETTGLSIGFTGTRPIRNIQERRRLCWEIVKHAEAQLTDPERCELARELGKRLGIDYEPLVRQRIFNIMTAEEIRSLVEAGIDIQLHTHRHRFPADRAVVRREINENRAYLEKLVEQPLVHFCYPSGLWTREHPAWLDELGMASSTTCDPGFCNAATPRQALPRFLDADDTSMIEFEAEMCGVAEWMRGMRARLKQMIEWKFPARGFHDFRKGGEAPGKASTPASPHGIRA